MESRLSIQFPKSKLAFHIFPADFLKIFTFFHFLNISLLCPNIYLFLFRNNSHK